MVWYCMVFWPRYFCGIIMVQYHGTTMVVPWYSDYHGITMVQYHGTTMVVPWYSDLVVPRPNYHGNTVPWYYHDRTMVLYEETTKMRNQLLNATVT